MEDGKQDGCPNLSRAPARGQDPASVRKRMPKAPGMHPGLLGGYCGPGGSRAGLSRAPGMGAESGLGAWAR